MVGGISSTNTASISQMWQNLLNKADTDGDGSISKSEFAAGAPENTTGSASFEDIFTKMDTDGNGSISDSEFATAAAQMNSSSQMDPSEMFANLDTDGNGSIDESEFEAGAPPQGAGAPPPPPPGGPSQEEIFTSMDTNGDGSVSESEFETAFANMNASSTDTSTTSTDTSTTLSISSIESELSALLSTTDDSDTLFTSIDTNGDGVIDKGELATARTQVEMTITDIFNEIDSDDDNSISSDELTSILGQGNSNSNSIAEMIQKAYTANAESTSTLASSSLSLLA